MSKKKRDISQHKLVVKFVGVIPDLPECWREMVEPLVGKYVTRMEFRAGLSDLCYDGCIVELDGQRYVVDSELLKPCAGEVVAEVAL